MKISPKLKKILTVALTIVLYIAFALIEEFAENGPNTSHTPNPKVTYSKHAKCRMDCRNISKENINYTINKGKINQRKSDPQAKPCPIAAYESWLPDNRQLRIVVGDCKKSDVIITAIDISAKKKFDCSCR